MSDINKDLPGQLVDWLPHDNDGQLCISNDAEVYFRDMIHDALTIKEYRAAINDMVSKKIPDTDFFLYSDAIEGLTASIAENKRELIDVIIRETVQAALENHDASFRWAEYL